jgi:hypothetical protein
MKDRGIAIPLAICTCQTGAGGINRNPEPYLDTEKANPRLTFHDSRLATNGVPIPFRRSCVDFSPPFGLQFSCLRTAPGQSTGGGYPVGHAGGQENGKRGG